MKRRLRRVLRVVGRFLLAGGFIRAVDDPGVDLSPCWQLTMHVLTQLIVAVGQA